MLKYSQKEGELMKLTREQLATIDEHINSSLIDKEKLITYLEKHRIIKNDVFSKCARRGKKLKFDEDYCCLLNSSEGYSPLNRSIFIRRIPFLFHNPLQPNSNQHLSGLWNVLPISKEKSNAEELESIYADMEFMYYELHIDLEYIFSYSKSQIYRPSKSPNKNNRTLSDLFWNKDPEMFGFSDPLNQRDIFKIWRHYLRLCKQLNSNDYLPERLLTAYNFALEKA